MGLGGPHAKKKKKKKKNNNNNPASPPLSRAGEPIIRSDHPHSDYVCSQQEFAA